MTTRLPADLRYHLDNFLADNRDVPYKRFCLLTFLAEALLCAESNQLTGDGFADVPALAAMLERLDEHIDFLVDSSERRQQRAVHRGPAGALPTHVLEYFDAPGYFRADDYRPFSGAGL